MLIGLMSAQLKIPPEQIERETPFDEFGLDSISLTSFGNALYERYGLTLSPTVFFEVPTIASLSAYLVREHGAQLAPTLEPIAATNAILPGQANIRGPLGRVVYPRRQRRLPDTGSVDAGENGLSAQCAPTTMYSNSRVDYTETLRSQNLVHADRLQLPDFLDSKAVDAARSLPLASGSSRGTPLLTGANGFIGRFLALSLLDQLPKEGRLYCMVRADANDTATKRLVDSFASTPELARRIATAVQENRITVLAGDLTKALSTCRE
jgi:acyl carrier protein